MSKLKKVLLVIGGLFVVLFIIGIVAPKSPETPHRLAEQAAQRDAKRAQERREAEERAKAQAIRHAELDRRMHPEKQISVKDFEWDKSGFGSVMMATFTVQNENEFAVKDFKLSCVLFGGSGTKIDSASDTVYEIVGANKSRRFKEVNMGFIRSQASKASCEVVTATAM